MGKSVLNLRLPRRHFLGLAGVAVCHCLAPWPKLAAAAQALQGASAYANQDKLLSEFKQLNAAAKIYLAAKYGPELAKTVTQHALSEYRDLLPGLPEVGGEANWVSVFIPVSGWYLAYYRAMKPQGLAAQDTGRMIYDLEAEELKANPGLYAAQGEALFSHGYQSQMRAWAEWTQMREYPFNWVASYVPGDGVNFDFGYDYSECGLLKYLTAMGAPELAVYQCFTDFSRSRAENSGLERSGSLAMGRKLCDFRYKRGRAVTQDWDSEIMKIQPAKS